MERRRLDIRCLATHARFDCLHFQNHKICLHFDTLLTNLNSILLGQYLQKENMSIDRSDLNLIQKSDRHLGSIMQKILQGDQPNENTKFVIINDILFKYCKIFDKKVPRLCLPISVSREVLFKIHNLNHCHVGGANLLDQFNANFYCENADSLVKHLSQLCLFCRLNTDRKIF